MKRSKFFFGLGLPALTLAALALAGAPADTLDKDLASGLRTIKPADGYEYTRILASKEFAGRLTGHEGYTAAARWAAAEAPRLGPQAHLRPRTAISSPIPRPTPSWTRPR